MEADSDEFFENMKSIIQSIKEAINKWVGETSNHQETVTIMIAKISSPKHLAAIIELIKPKPRSTDSRRRDMLTKQTRIKNRTLIIFNLTI